MFIQNLVRVIFKVNVESLFIIIGLPYKSIQSFEKKNVLNHRDC